MTEAVKKSYKLPILLALLAAVIIIFIITGRKEVSLEPLPSFEENLAALAAGEIDYADASWWGFDEFDSTHALQAAIDSGASRVIVPNMDSPWLVEPLFLVDDQEIIFEEGTVVEAKPGSFHGVADCLFTARGKQNITLSGYGATLRMRKSDYQSEDYQPAEWRHLIGLFGSSNIVIEGLRLESSGGDGVYLGAGSWGRPGWEPRRASDAPSQDLPHYCRDVIIRDIVADDNHRQGISVISVENLLIEDSLLKNTSGTAPQAGIDIEPNSARAKLINIVLRNVVSEGNAGAGFFIHIRSLDHTTEPISIRFEDCVARNNNSDVFSFHAPGGDQPVEGLIEFINLVGENNGGPAMNFRQKPAASVLTRFVNCRFENVAQRDSPYARYPIWFQMREVETLDQGGIEFVDCVLKDNQDRPFIGVINQGEVKVGLTGITGNIEVHNPYGATMRIDPETTDFKLEIIEGDEH